MFTVKYHAGTYEGQKTVNARDAEEAITKVRAWVHRQTAMPMLSESYEIIDIR